MHMTCYHPNADLPSMLVMLLKIGYTQPLLPRFWASPQAPRLRKHRLVLQESMLFHLSQIAAVSVVCLSLLLESKLCTAEPCLDLYKGLQEPLARTSYGHAYLTMPLDCPCRGNATFCALKHDTVADVERPAVYNIDEIEDVSPIFGLSHKTISGMHHHGMKQLEVPLQSHHLQVLKAAVFEVFHPDLIQSPLACEHVAVIIAAHCASYAFL